MRMSRNDICPFCKQPVMYWRSSDDAQKEKNEKYIWVITKRHTKQFIHKSCYLNNPDLVRNRISPKDNNKGNNGINDT